MSIESSLAYPLVLKGFLCSVMIAASIVAIIDFQVRVFYRLLQLLSLCQHLPVI